MNEITTIQAAKLVSIPLAFGLAGYGFSASQNNVRHLYDQPAGVGAAIFAQVYHEGAAVVAPGALASALASAYLAYALPPSPQRALWAGAGALTLAPLAYTAVIMLPGVQRLLAIAESSVEQEKVDRSREHVALLGSWVAHNYLRASLYFAGGICGLLAVVGS